jgi:hypothetical protein
LRPWCKKNPAAGQLKFASIRLLAESIVSKVRALLEAIALRVSLFMMRGNRRMRRSIGRVAVAVFVVQASCGLLLQSQVRAEEAAIPAIPLIQREFRAPADLTLFLRVPSQIPEY